MGPQSALKISSFGSVTRVGGSLSATPPTHAILANHFPPPSLSFPICTIWTKRLGIGDFLEFCLNVNGSLGLE